MPTNRLDRLFAYGFVQLIVGLVGSVLSSLLSGDAETVSIFLFSLWGVLGGLLMFFALALAFKASPSKKTPPSP